MHFSHPVVNCSTLCYRKHMHMAIMYAFSRYLCDCCTFLAKEAELRFARGRFAISCCSTLHFGILHCTPPVILALFGQFCKFGSIVGPGLVPKFPDLFSPPPRYWCIRPSLDSMNSVLGELFARMDHLVRPDFARSVLDGGKLRQAACLVLFLIGFHCPIEALVLLFSVACFI